MKAESVGRFNNGQSTIEILIALTVLTISLTGAAAVIFSSQSLSVDAQESNQAIRLAGKGLEAARALARDDFSALASSSSTKDEFLEEVAVENVGATTKKVTSRVSWRTDPLRVQKVELTTLMTNWYSSVSSGGDTGGGGLAGDWSRPKTLSSIDLGPGNSATDLDVINKIVYLSAIASSLSKPDFFVINATDGQNSYIVSELDTGPGLNSVDVAGSYAYVANNSVNAQLQIIDLTNAANPVLIKSYKLPNTSGPGAIGNSIFYSNSKVYIGTQKATGPEFHIIDVSSANNPTELGSFEINADVNGIRVVGSTAYLAVSSNDELKILDVSNPANITQIGNYDAPGDSEDGKSLFLVGTKLYLARLLGGNHDDHHELHVLDVSNPASPQNLGSKNFTSSINDIAVRDNIAFLATDDSNEEFQALDVSNPASITKISSFNFPNIATGIDYEDNLIYVAVRSNDALRIITSQ